MELEHADRDVERGSQGALHRIEHRVPKLFVAAAIAVVFVALGFRHFEHVQLGVGGQVFEPIVQGAYASLLPGVPRIDAAVGTNGLAAIGEPALEQLGERRRRFALFEAVHQGGIVEHDEIVEAKHAAAFGDLERRADEPREGGSGGCFPPPRGRLARGQRGPSEPRPTARHDGH